MAEKKQLKKNGQFRFSADHEVCISEKSGDMTREPWLMLLSRRDQKQTKTLCWGLTNNGTSFARIGTQEGDIVNGFVHEDPYKTRALGPYAYIVDENGKYFTNTWYPVLHKTQKLDTTFGFGYVKYSTAYNDFEVETTNFVPNEYDAMVQVLKIKNTSKKARKVKLFNVFPINIGDARDIQFSGFNTLMMGGSKVDKEVNATVWRSAYGIPVNDSDDEILGMFGKVAVHTTSLPNSNFATRYDEFVGHHSNTMANPEGVAFDTLPNRDAQENSSALSTILNTVSFKAGEEKEIIVTLIAASTQDYYKGKKKELKKTIATLTDSKKVWKMFDTVKGAWKQQMDMLQINVPGETELMPCFKWLQYQCSMVALLNRMKSRYHSGFEYGYGFRDILQDLLALLPYYAEQVRPLIKYVAEQMFSDGYVYHNFFVSAKGNKGFVACDDPLWFIYTVCEYVKETGDLAVLSDVAPYADEKEGLPAKKGTILEHMKVAIAKVWGSSDDGLPYMLMADWNDDLSGLFGHTSTMAAQQLFKALNDFCELLAVKGGEEKLIADYKKKAAIVQKSVETRCIDPKTGAYIRALAPKDVKKAIKAIPAGTIGMDPAEIKKEVVASSEAGDLGSIASDGFVFFEPIAWAGFSGIATEERFKKALAACDKYLDDKYGVAICQGDKTMASGKLPPDWSAWKRNAPGKKENGGEFRHLESWYIASLCKYGYGEKAYDLYIRTLPSVASSHDPYNYAVERFVYPEYCSGPASNDHGKAGHTWLTGTAPTRLGVLIDWVFGIRRAYNGLLIDPCVTKKWKAFSAVRTFRGTTFTVNFKNPQGVNKGVKSITVDGKAITGQIIPAKFCDGKKHVVEVVMGK